eukprot:NODE_24_length_41419_cov_0.818780.p34 type:complete len:113 gc:universal NODE_24_length_41419_cov_0.818780:4797-4459(-)
MQHLFGLCHLNAFSKKMDKMVQLVEHVLVLDENTGNITMNSVQLAKLKRRLNKFKVGLEHKEQRMVKHERNMRAQLAQQQHEFEVAVNNKNLAFEAQMQEREMYFWGIGVQK